MIDLQIIKNKQQIRLFHQLPGIIYKNDPNYVMPLISETEDIFSSKNPFLKRGKCRRWIAFKDGKIAGRIAAFYNYDKAYRQDPPTGGMGFFECINDIKVSFSLFEAGEKWLAEHGLSAAEGPVNFGENNDYWGLLVEGFTQPAYGMSYNPSYYKNLFESYGFKAQYEQYTNHFNVNKPLPERFRRIVKRVQQRKDYTFEPLNIQNLDKYVDDFITIYNQAWAFHENFKPMERDYVLKTFQQMKPVMVPEMIWFAYVRNKPAGFIVAVPDLNQIFRKFNGRLHLINKLRFLWHKKKKTINRARVIIMGIVPEYQQKGLESSLIVNSFDAVRKLGQYREAELSWVGSFNPGMMAIHKASGAESGKKHITYKKIFDKPHKDLIPDISHKTTKAPGLEALTQKA